METMDEFLKVDGISSEPDAVTWAINAAVQRNRVYRSEFRPGQFREQFREEFKALMRFEAGTYASGVSEQQHCSAILRIAETLSSRFGSVLRGGRLRYGTAQKAFNLYLKYLWRLRRVSLPPHCPIDRVVLTAARIEGRWTTSDSECEYMGWINRIRALADAKGLSLAEWEHQEWLRWKRRQE